LKGAARSLIEAIRGALGWDLGALWTLDPTRQHLYCVDAGHAPGADFPKFEEATREGVLATGEGLPGRVWQSIQPAWIPSIADDRSFSRSQVASSEGLRSALAFPIPSSGELLGVVELFSRETREPEEDLLRMVRATGDQIGV